MANDKFFKVKNGIEAPSGSAASPSITIAGDLDTGMFSGGADSISLTTGGVERLNIDSSGDFDFKGGTLSNTNLSGGTTFDLGSASSPSITFTGDLDTGVYSPAANQVGISTNGTLRLSLTTTSINSALPISLGSNKITDLDEPTASTDAATKNYVDSVSGGTPTFADGTALLPSITFTSDTNSGMYLPGSDTLGLVTAGSEVMRLTGGQIRASQDGTVSLPSFAFQGDVDTGFYLAATGEIGVATSGTLRAEFKTNGLAITSGTLLLPAGSVGTPAMRFSADGDTGIYNAGTNQLAISTAGVERVKVFASGNTSFSGSILASNGTAAIPSISFFNDDDTGIYRSGANVLGISTGGVERVRVDSGGLHTATNTSIFLQDGSASSPSLRFSLDDDTGIFRPTTNTLAFTTGASERLRIDASGNVGIGDTSPNHLLDLDFADAGTIDNTDTLLPGTVDNIALHIQNTDNTATQSGIVLATRTSSSSNWAIINEWTGSFVGDLVFRTRTTGSASEERLRILSSGAVRVSAGYPQLVLRDTDSTGNACLGEIKWENSSGTRTGYLGQSSTGDEDFIWQNDAAAGNIKFFTNGLQALLIRSNQQVGVRDGTASSPALTFQNDINTGIFRESSDVIGFTAGGSQRVTIGTGFMSFHNGVKLYSTDGTAALPSISFASDTDTGIYRLSSDQLGFTTGGVHRLTIDNSNNLVFPVNNSTAYWTGGNGIINTASSCYINIDADNTDADTERFQIAKNRAGNSGGTVLFTVAETGDVDVFGDLDMNGNSINNTTLTFSGGTATAPGYSFSGDSNTGMFSDAADNLGFSTNGTERLTIDNLGRVGVLNTSPADDLVVGNGSNSTTDFGIMGSSACDLNFRDATQTEGRISYDHGINTMYFYSANLVLAMGLDGPNNRIDTYSDVRQYGDFTMQSGALAKIFLETGTETAPSLAFGGDTNTGIYQQTADTLTVTAGGDASCIFRNTSSNFGRAGTSADAYELDLEGASSSSTIDANLSNGGSVFRIRNGDNVTSTNYSAIAWHRRGQSYVSSGIVFQGNSGGSDSGDVKIVNRNTSGTLNTNITVKQDRTVQFNGYGAGTLSTDASGNISASDARLKTVLNREVLGRDSIMALNPVWYDWNEDSGFSTEHSELGFTAQSVAEVIPEASPGTDESVEIRNYHDRAIIASLVKHNQELEQDKEDLQSKVSELEGTLSQVLTRLNALENK